jgi:8-oxo-dGTP diphosphatase
MMEPLDGEFEPSHEVDEVRWLTPAAADRLLSYDHDRELLREVSG